MMTSGKVNMQKFAEPQLLNLELDTGCTCMEVMPIPDTKGDHLANAVDGKNDVHNTNMVSILAGCEDGSIILTEMATPEQEDDFHEEFKDISQFEDHEEDQAPPRGRGRPSKHSKTKPPKNQYKSHNDSYYGSYNSHQEFISTSKAKESVYLHKDMVTSIRQRPGYPFQFLSTSLDGEAILSLLSDTLTREDFVILRFSNKICEEGIGDAAWMDPNCFLAKNEAYGQIMLQDVREGEGKNAMHLYTTPNL